MKYSAIVYLKESGPTLFESAPAGILTAVNEGSRAASYFQGFEVSVFSLTFDNTSGFWDTVLNTEDRFLKGCKVEVYRDGAKIFTGEISEIEAGPLSEFSFQVSSAGGMEKEITKPTASDEFEDCPEAARGKIPILFTGRIEKEGGGIPVYLVREKRTGEKNNRWLIARHFVDSLLAVFDPSGGEITESFYLFNDNATGYSYVVCEAYGEHAELKINAVSSLRATTGGELVETANFATWNDSSDATNWTINQGGTGSSVEQSTETQDGGYSVKMIHNSFPACSIVSDSFNLLPGRHVFSITFRTETTQAQGVTPRIVEESTGNFVSWTGFDSTASLVFSVEWETRSITFDTTGGNFHIEVEYSSTGSIGTGYIDSVSLYHVTDGVSNPARVLERLAAENEKIQFSGIDAAAVKYAALGFDSDAVAIVMTTKTTWLQFLREFAVNFCTVFVPLIDGSKELRVIDFHAPSIDHPGIDMTVIDKKEIQRKFDEDRLFLYTVEYALNPATGAYPETLTQEIKTGHEQQAETMQMRYHQSGDLARAALEPLSILSALPLPVYSFDMPAVVAGDFELFETIEAIFEVRRERLLTAEGECIELPGGGVLESQAVDRRLFQIMRINTGENTIGFECIEVSELAALWKQRYGG